MRNLLNAINDLPHGEERRRRVSNHARRQCSLYPSSISQFPDTLESPGLLLRDKIARHWIGLFVETLCFALDRRRRHMSGLAGLEIIHIIWDGPLDVDTATKSNDDNSDCGIYQIYGPHAVSGPDTLLYIGQVYPGTFAPRIEFHYKDWGRWLPDPISVYLGRIAGKAPVTSEDWRKLIDKAEAVLIRKIQPASNAARIYAHKYKDNPILIVNHGSRHRLPECLSTFTDFIHTDEPDFMVLRRVAPLKRREHTRRGSRHNAMDQR
jgi:hypothetical protein